MHAAGAFLLDGSVWHPSQLQDFVVNFARDPKRYVELIELLKRAKFLCWPDDHFRHAALAEATIYCAEMNCQTDRSAVEYLHTVLNVWKAVRCPPDLQLWKLPGVSDRLSRLFEKGFQRVPEIVDGSDSRREQGLAFAFILSSELIEKIPALEECASAVLAAVHPLVDFEKVTLRNELQKTPEYEIIERAFAAIRVFASDVRNVTNALRSRPDLLPLRLKEIAVYLARISRPINTLEGLRKNPALADSGRELAAEIAENLPDLTRPLEKEVLDLAHTASVVAFKTQRDAVGVTSTIRAIVRAAYEIAVEWSTRTQKVSFLPRRSAGRCAEIARNYAQLCPSRSYAAAEKAIEWLLYQYDNPANCAFPHRIVWLDCLEILGDYGAISDAAAGWLQTNQPNDCGAGSLRLRLAEIALIKLERGIVKWSPAINAQVQAWLSAAAASGRDPRRVKLEQGDEIIHFRLARLARVAEDWPTVAKQADYAASLLREANTDRFARQALSRSLALRGEALSRLGRPHLAIRAYREAMDLWWSTYTLQGLLEVTLREHGVQRWCEELENSDPANPELTIGWSRSFKEHIQHTFSEDHKKGGRIWGLLAERRPEWQFGRIMPLILGWAKPKSKERLATLGFMLGISSGGSAEMNRLRLQVVVDRYFWGSDPQRHDDALAVVAQWIVDLPDAHDRALEATESCKTLFATILETALQKYVDFANDIIQSRDSRRLEELLKTGSTLVKAPFRPQNYQSNDRFSLDQALATYLQGLGRQKDSWRFIVAPSGRWVRALSWLALRVELDRLFFPLSNKVDDPSRIAISRLEWEASGGSIEFAAGANGLRICFSLDRPVDNEIRRGEIERCLEQWKKSLPLQKKPRYAWASDFCKLNIVITQRWEPAPLTVGFRPAVEAAFDFYLKFGRVRMDLLRKAAQKSPYLRCQSDLEKFLTMLLDQLTMRTFLWLAEESHSRHPREVLHHFKDSIHSAQPDEIRKIVALMRKLPAYDIRRAPHQDLGELTVSATGVTLPLGLIVRIDADLARMVVVALWANACERAPQLEEIQVTLRREEATAVLSITNPISDNERPGSRIGLGLARSIAALHGGSVLTDESRPKFFSVRVSLPLSIETEKFAEEEPVMEDLVDETGG